MAKPLLMWAEFQGGYIGILPCGLTIAQSRINDGPYQGAYQVRFGTCEIRKIFWDPVEARQAGRDLARKTLRECLDAIARDEAQFYKGEPSSGE